MIPLSTATMPSRLNWKERAEQAAQDAEQEERGRLITQGLKQMPKLHQLIGEILGIRLSNPTDTDTITGRARVTLDGVTFGVNGDDLVILFTCPHCGERTQTRDILSLAELGAVLRVPFQPTYGHYCSKRLDTESSRTTAEDAMLAAIRGIIHQEMDER